MVRRQWQKKIGRKRRITVVIRYRLKTRRKEAIDYDEVNGHKSARAEEEAVEYDDKEEEYCSDDEPEEPFRLHFKTTPNEDPNIVVSLDLHPTEPWILVGWLSGMVIIWNHHSRTQQTCFKMTEFGAKSAKFVARKQWVIAGDEVRINVYNHYTWDEITKFIAHKGFVLSVAVHPTLPYVLSSDSSDDMVIKLWDWDQCWACTRIFQGHSHFVMQLTFNPEDTNLFASASRDGTIKIWNLQSSLPYFTLDAHQKAVNCLDFFSAGDKLYLITGSDDKTAKVWDYQTRSCVQTLEGQTERVYAVCFHPQLLLIITGSRDGSVRFWNSVTYRLENVVAYSHEKVLDMCCMTGSRRVSILYKTELVCVKFGHEIPVASMNNLGNIIWVNHKEIQTTDIRLIGAGYEVTDGKILPLAVQKLGTCRLHPQYLKHSPNGQFVSMCVGKEYIIHTSMSWRNKTLFGSALEFVWSFDGEYAVRESTSEIKIFTKTFMEKMSIRPTFSAKRIYGGTLLAMRSNNFLFFYDWEECRMIRKINTIGFNIKNLYWTDNGDLLAIASDTSFYIYKYNRDTVSSYLKSGRPIDELSVEDTFELLHKKNEGVRTGIWFSEFFIYINSSWRLDYIFRGEVVTVCHLDRPMYLLGYVASQSRVYLIDKEFNVIGFTLLLGLIEYKTRVMHGDFERAKALLPSIPKEHHNIVAHFLELHQQIEEALDLATDPYYRFELAIKLGRLEIATEIADGVESKSMWKQLGEFTMFSGKLEMAEEYLNRAMDISGLLLLYSSIGDAQGICRVSKLAQQQGENNVAFLCLFMLGKLEECLQLLLDNNRIPEAAFMARSYLPSRVPEIVRIWKKDLSKMNPKAAESLANPQEYPHLFKDWQIALAAEMHKKHANS